MVCLIQTGALTLRFGSHLLAELTITLRIISFITIINLWCYQLGKCRYHALRYNLYHPHRKHARRASNVPERCVTRTFAAEQVCGGCVPCVTRTSVAPGTHVEGTAVEVPAGIKFAFAGCPNRTGNTRRRCTAVRCMDVFATFPQETQRTQQLLHAVQ